MKMTRIVAMLLVFLFLSPLLPAGVEARRLRAVPNTSPTAGFTFSIKDEVVTFDASASTDPDGDPLTFGWDFGDGTALTAVGPLATHTYQDGGSFHVSLRVADDQGGVASASRDLSAAPAAHEGAKETISVGTAAWVYRQLPVRISTLSASYNILTAAASPCNQCGSPADHVILFLGEGFVPTSSTYTCMSDGIVVAQVCSVPIDRDAVWFVGIYNPVELGAVDLTISVGPSVGVFRPTVYGETATGTASVGHVDVYGIAVDPPVTDGCTIAPQDAACLVQGCNGDAWFFTIRLTLVDPHPGDRVLLTQAGDQPALYQHAVSMSGQFAGVATYEDPVVYINVQLGGCNTSTTVAVAGLTVDGHVAYKLDH